MANVEGRHTCSGYGALSSEESCCVVSFSQNFLPAFQASKMWAPRCAAGAHFPLIVAFSD